MEGNCKRELQQCHSNLADILLLRTVNFRKERHAVSHGVGAAINLLGGIGFPSAMIEVKRSRGLL